MRTDWTSSHNPYLPAIEQANTLLVTPPDKSVFKPVVDYLWLNPFPENETPQQLFGIYLPKAIGAISQKQRQRMEKYALRGLGDVAPSTTGLIIDPNELDRAAQSLGLLLSGGGEGVNEYTRVQFIDEWVKKFYPSLRYLSEGNITPEVRSPVAMAEVALEQTESMIENELSYLHSQIDYSETPFGQKLSLMTDLERTEKLGEAVRSLEISLEPLCKALHPEAMKRSRKND